MDIGWALFAAYVVILFVMVLAVRKRGAMRRTIWTLSAVTVVATVYQLLLGNHWHYSVFMIAVNAAACRIITRQPADEWQSLIGWSFVVQIGMDAGRAASELFSGPGDITFLGDVTTGIAYAQLALVIGWGVHARMGSPVWRGRDNPVAVASHFEGRT